MTSLFICLLNLSFSQSIITGYVYDNDNEAPLIGASIENDMTNTGTTTDIDGSFSIQATAGDVLTVSYIGYTSATVSVGVEIELNIRLEPGVLFDEVVVTGYSVDSRRKVSGSVSTVTARDVQIAPSGNVEQQLQGRVAGLNVISNGQPGTTSQIRVRGYGALGGNAPLFVVDGVAVNSVDFLSPGDIESITVLKDAGAASIYGARAAGGVIVYTTKMGTKKNEKLRVSYDAMIGMTSPGEGRPILNPQEQADWTWEAIRNAAILAGLDPVFSHPQYGNGPNPILPDYLLVGTESGIVGNINLEEQKNLYNINLDAGPIYQVIKANKTGTNWYDAITQNALISRHHLGFSGGSEVSRYYIGVGLQDQEGIISNQKFSRYTFRANTEFDIAPYLRIGENIQGTYRSTRILSGEGGGIGSAGEQTLIQYISRSSPILPVYDEFGGWAGNTAPGLGLFSNYVASLDDAKDDRDFSVQAFGNFYVELEPLSGLVLRSSLGGQFISNNSRQYGKETYYNIAPSRGGFSQFSSYLTRWIWTNTATYKKRFGQHDVDILIGQEALDEGTGFSISGAGINPFSQNVDFVGLSTVSSTTVDGSPFNGVRFSSFFTRLNYIFDDKYIASIVLRKDGSSRFGTENRYGVFPAFSFAWRISSERFLQNIGFIDDLKLRGGYGIMGNSNNVDPNNQFSLFATNIHDSSYDIYGTNSSAAPGFFRSRIGNPAAKWEQAITTNIGLDALLFDGKIDIGLELWQKETEDLLFRLPVTVQSGFFAQVPFVNVGKMLNQGIDFVISTKGKLNALRYQISLNGGFLHNEIVQLAPGIDDLPNQSANYGTIVPVLNQVGQPLSAFYGFDVQGLFKDQAEVDAAAVQEGASPGRFRYRDIDEDGKITQDDRTNLGNPIADFTGGLAITLAYKNLELSVYGYTSLGNEIYNISRNRTDFYNSEGSAISQRVKNSWTFEHTETEVPIFENTSNFSTNTQSNSYYIEDGSYFRLQNLTLSYLIPQSILQQWNFEQVRIYLSTNNLFTISKYSGLDPGVAGARDTNFGIDLGNFPVTRNITFGVNLNL